MDTKVTVCLYAILSHIYINIRVNCFLLFMNTFVLNMLLVRHYITVMIFNHNRVYLCVYGYMCACVCACVCVCGVYVCVCLRACVYARVCVWRGGIWSSTRFVHVYVIENIWDLCELVIYFYFDLSRYFHWAIRRNMLSLIILQRGNIIRWNIVHHILRLVPGADCRGVMLDDQSSSTSIMYNVFYSVSTLCYILNCRGVGNCLLFTVNYN